MAYTISTHNGSKVARGHNVRDRKITDKESHIDPNGEFEIWYDEPPRKAYDRIFGEAQKKYNAKQSRNDRKIKDYFFTVNQNEKQHTVYEMIITVGNLKNPVSKEIGKNIMKKFVDTWQQRNPNLDMIGAYYHADEEGVPHVHIDYIPVAHGYTRGMEIQAGLVKALGEQGFVKNGKATAQIQWQHRENLALEEICVDHGLEIEHPQVGKGIKHEETKNYKLKEENKENEQKIAEQKSELEGLKCKLQGVEDEIAAAGAERDAYKAYSSEFDATASSATKKHVRISSEEYNALCKGKAAAEAEARKLKGGLDSLRNSISACHVADLERKIQDLQENVNSLSARLLAAQAPDLDKKAMKNFLKNFKASDGIALETVFNEWKEDPSMFKGKTLEAVFNDLKKPSKSKGGRNLQR